jgi:hypothetical protein
MASKLMCIEFIMRMGYTTTTTTYIDKNSGPLIKVGMNRVYDFIVNYYYYYY